MKKRILYIFVIPLILLLIFIYYTNRFNKTKITDQLEKITVAEGVTIRNLIEVSGSHLAAEDEEGFKQFLDHLYKNPLIVYIGVFKNGKLHYLLSRFEGYFPVSGNQADTRIIDSPIGRIFDITAVFSDNKEQRYRLHIGFNYQVLSHFEEAANRNFLVVAGLFAVLMLIILGIVVYFDRLAYRKEWELEREKQEKERFKDLAVLTSEIAHEIKNPLNSIYLSFNALEPYWGEQEDAVFYRDAIKGEIKRISGIIQSYSNLSKEIDPAIQTIEMDHFLKEFQFILDEELKSSGARLDIRLPGNVAFQTDGNLLKQVLFNLVKNSLEAGASLITLDVIPGKNEIQLILADNGRGMSEKTAVELFKPYSSTKTKGMGLGLYIVMKIVKALEGSIKLVSYEAGKTVFEITLPTGHGPEAS